MNGTEIDTAVSLLIHEVKPLKHYCEEVVTEEINGTHIEATLKSFSKKQREVFMELLPLNTSLDSTVPIIFDEMYWKRKCIAGNWNYVHYWINNCSWRDVFICYFVEEAIDNFLAKNHTFEEMMNKLEVFADHLKRVKINGYKGNVGDNSKKSNSRSRNTSFEENVRKLFTFFPNLEELYLNIAPAEYAVKEVTEGEIKGANLLKDIFFLKNLTKLTIIGYSMKESQISMLTDYLLDSFVGYLNLSCNLLKDDCCVSLGNALQSQYLHTLILSSNCIGSAGIKDILRGLDNNSILLSLDLSKNCVTDEGGVALAEMLKSKFFLRKLDISFNKLGSESGVVFKDVIELNTSLLHLNITGNALGKDVGRMFAESISKNKSIRYFGIEFCGFDEKEEDSIYTRIHRNTNAHDCGIFF